MATKHALLIGVDKYCNLDKKYELSGCVNDAQLIKSVLTTYYGFEDSNITELHNETATREGILAGMEGLVSRVKKDDIVVFHFSGHGSRRTAADLSKGTGKDSTIMPHDSGRNPLPNLDIANTEINEWLVRLTEKTPNVSLTFDCCHSGTVTRDAFAATVRAVPDDTRSIEDMELPAGAATRGSGDTGWMALSDRYVVMSGCRDNEYSHEFSQEDGGKTIRNGALTHFLTNALIKAKPGTTYRDVFELAHQGVNTKFPTQNPQIEGAKDRELFGTTQIEPLRFVPVTAVDGNSVTLAGGAAHGLVSGSLWSVLPAGTKKQEGVTPLGAIKIEEVGSTRSTASITEGGANIEAGTRCIELAPAPHKFTLKVDLSTLQDDAAIRTAINESDLLDIAASTDAAEVRVYLLAPRSHSEEPVPSVENLTEESWAVVNEQGELAAPLHATSESGVLQTVVTNLETLSRYRNALRLDNPNQDLKVEFNILRETGNDDWEVANGGQHTFAEGECVAFELINNEDRPVFLSVLDFGLSGKISLLYPPRTSSELIDAGKTLRIGTDNRRIRLGLPRNFSHDQGTGALKAFVTSEEADFQWLQQEATRSVATGGLRKQFETAYNGPKFREASFDSAEEEPETWTATARSFDIRRK